MAADTLTCSGDTIVSRSERKIYRMNGCLLGFAGETCNQWMFLRWFETHDLDNRPKLGEHFSAVVMGPKGLFKYWDDCIPIQMEDEYATAGSGWTFAMSALKLGKTPIEAVRHAMEMDVATGGRVRCQHL